MESAKAPFFKSRADEYPRGCTSQVYVSEYLSEAMIFSTLRRLRRLPREFDRCSGRTRLQTGKGRIPSSTEAVQKHSRHAGDIWAIFCKKIPKLAKV